MKWKRRYEIIIDMRRGRLSDVNKWGGGRNGADLQQAYGGTRLRVQV